MRTVDVHEAKSILLRLVKAVETGADDEILITRDGRVIARLVSIKRQPVRQRIGVAKGAFEVPETIDALNDEIEGMLR